MKAITDLAQFKTKVIPTIEGYELRHRFFEEGDFGALHQFEFNSKKIGGNIDFWGLGWLGVFIWDYEKEEQILNILLEPDQEEEQEKVLKEIQFLLEVV